MNENTLQFRSWNGKLITTCSIIGNHGNSEGSRLGTVIHTVALRERHIEPISSGRMTMSDILARPYYQKELRIAEKMMMGKEEAQ
jgi:hypothetical protein